MAYSRDQDEHRRRMDAWLEALQQEAAGRGKGTEMERRFATLKLCQLARGDAKMAVILADNLLDYARRAVENETYPAVDFGRIAIPDFMRSQDRARVLQEFTLAAAKRLLDRDMSWWERTWWRIRESLKRNFHRED